MPTDETTSASRSRQQRFLTRQLPATWRNAGLILCAALLPSASAIAADALDTSTRDLHQKGQYDAAASRGLNELLNEPWNHELRFVVADSLQRSGKADEAATQFEALEGTPYAESATLRLNALRPNQPARKLTAPAVRTADAASAVPQYQFVSPDSPRPRSASPQSEPRTSAYTLINPAVPVVVRNPAQQQIYDLSAAENYRAAGTQGLALFARETPDDALRLVVANSLAWTGRLSEAIQQYQFLLKGKLAKEANVGLANVYRWRGRDDLALPLYRTVLAADPDNTGAKEGLELAQRELRPHTLVTMAGSSDSSNMQRRALTVKHRWRDDSGRNLYEVETSGVNDHLLETRVNQRDLTLRYQALNLPLQPRFELTAQGKPERAAYGGVKVKLGERSVFVDVGRVNWGRLAANARALQGDLAATHVGMDASGAFSFGQLGARADYYDISDGNAIFTSGLSYTPAWRPLGSHVKPFVGMETRDARNTSPNYWSPAGGFGTLYAGVLGEWSGASWDFFASGQAGTRLYGEAGTNWSLSAGGRRWLGKDLALGLNLWNMSSWRDNATYRAKSMTMSLEKIWN